jgi:hypothetical protein
MIAERYGVHAGSCARIDLNRQSVEHAGPAFRVTKPRVEQVRIPFVI